PSNFGLVLCFLVLGSSRVAPLDLWWVNPGLALTAALAVILVGGVALALRVRMVGVVVAFWMSLVAAVVVLVAVGHSMTARWHAEPSTPACGGQPGARRTRPRIRVGRLPHVRNLPSIRVTDRFSDAQATRVARDTVADLLILGRARRELDAGLATTAADQPTV